MRIIDYAGFVIVGLSTLFVINDIVEKIHDDRQRDKAALVACTEQLNSAVLEVNGHSSSEQDVIVLREKLEFADRRLKDVEDRNQELERRLVNGK